MSRIEWTDCTWNPVRGCSRVSEGCRNCYAERMAARFCGESAAGCLDADTSAPFFGFARHTGTPDGRAAWTGRVELIPEKLDEPLHWRKPRRVFVNSMSDLFHEALPDEAIDRVFAVMALAHQHTFQVLTKRPERMLRYLSDPLKAERWTVLSRDLRAKWAPYLGGWSPEWWPRFATHVWLGVSVEDQKTADERIPLLLETPAAKRFVSYEPALGPVDFGVYGWLTGCDACCNGDRCPGPPDCTRHDRASCPVCHGTARGTNLDQVIVGGESGPGARPCDVAWIRSVVRQCREAHTACFVKQLGAKPYDSTPGDYLPPAELVLMKHPKGGDPSEWPEDLRVREFPS